MAEVRVPSSIVATSPAEKPSTPRAVSFLHPGFSQVMPWFDRPGLDSFSWFGELFECFSNTAVAAVPRLRTGNDPGGHAARTAANGSCSI